MYRISRALLTILLCLPQLLKAQRLLFHHLNVENGLSQNSVIAIVQDNRGFMWFGDRYGLNRYDGENFRMYRNNYADSTTISDDYITTLFCDARHTLWVGTTNGLNRYDPERDAFNRVFPGENINCLYQDNQGTLWVGAADGLFKKTGTGFTPVLRGSVVRAVYEDHQGYLWVGATTGLLRLEPAPGGYHIQRVTDDHITSIREDEEQPRNLWIGTANGGLNKYDPATGTFHAFTHQNSGLINNNVRTICPDPSGRLWIGTQEGLTIFDPRSGQFTAYQHDPGDPESLSQNSIYSIFPDASGSMWIGTYFGGVNVVYSHATPFTVSKSEKDRSSLDNNVVSGFAEDAAHNLWIGTEGGGLNYWDRARNTFIAYKNVPGDPTSLGSNLVKVVYRDKDGNIWVGTHAGGLDLLDPVHGRFHRFLYNAQDPTLNSEVEAILEDSQGRFWIGAEDSLYVYKRTGSSLSPYPGISPLNETPAVRVLFEDSRHNVWMASTRALYVLRNGQTTFQAVLQAKGNNSFHSNFVNCIREDDRGRLWIGLYGAGLTTYDPATGKFNTYTQKDGLPNDNVLGIEEDNNGQLWISTDNGLSRFDPVSGVFKNYTASDGLAGSGFNYNSHFKDSRGELFFGGFNGFTSFFPAQIETNNDIVPLVFTSLDLFNKPVSIGGGILDRSIGFTDHIRFHYDQDGFTIHFALLNFIKPEKNRYAYKMDGVDKDWNLGAAASATYTGLPPGDYLFWVKGANNDGVWSKPAALRITILPPFWKTWWAYCFYALALAALVFLIVRYFFLRELLKREDALHQAKLNFFTNISHEIRTHLALIIGPVEKLLLRKRDPEDERQLRYVKKNSESLLQLVSELMDFRKAESGNLSLHVSEGNIVAFLKDIYASFEHLATSRGIQTDLLSSDDVISVFFDREQLEKVFFNLLSNAFKFTPDGGCINVFVEEEKTFVAVHIVDNGRGIAPENLDKLFINYYQENDYNVQNTGYGIGLALSKSIVELHKGSMRVESEMGSRTSFTVTLQKGRRHFSEGQMAMGGYGPAVPAGKADTGGLAGALRAAELSGKAEASASGPAPHAEGRAASTTKPSVLLVEDNPEVRAFVRSALEERYQVTESPDGLKGWEAATEDIPDLIISDVMMPEMDGLTLCGKLKTDERTSHIPVILLTAKTTTANQINGLEMGADLYLTKPFSIHILELHMRNLLSAREKMRQKFSQELVIQPRRVVVNTLDEQFIEKAISFIEERMDDPEFGVQMLSTHMAMSQPVLYKKIKALTDMSAGDFIKNIRLKKAAQLLREKRHTVYEVAYMVGYSDRKHFSKEFKKMFDRNPTDFAGDTQ